MGVSENSGFYPQIIHFNRDCHYKSSILGVFPLFLVTPILCIPFFFVAAANKNRPKKTSPMLKNLWEHEVKSATDGLSLGGIWSLVGFFFGGKNSYGAENGPMPRFPQKKNTWLKRLNLLRAGYIFPGRKRGIWGWDPHRTSN